MRSRSSVAKSGWRKGGYCCDPLQVVVLGRRRPLGGLVHDVHDQLAGAGGIIAADRGVVLDQREEGEQLGVGFRGVFLIAHIAAVLIGHAPFVHLLFGALGQQRQAVPIERIAVTRPGAQPRQIGRGEPQARVGAGRLVPRRGRSRALRDRRRGGRGFRRFGQFRGGACGPAAAGGQQDGGDDRGWRELAAWMAPVHELQLGAFKVDHGSSLSGGPQPLSVV